jgi:hypothetical protein
VREILEVVGASGKEARLPYMAAAEPGLGLADDGRDNGDLSGDRLYGEDVAGRDQDRCGRDSHRGCPQPAAVAPAASLGRLSAQAGAVLPVGGGTAGGGDHGQARIAGCYVAQQPGCDPAGSAFGPVYAGGAAHRS